MWAIFFKKDALNHEIANSDEKRGHNWWCAVNSTFNSKRNLCTASRWNYHGIHLARYHDIMREIRKIKSFLQINNFIIPDNSKVVHMWLIDDCSIYLDNGAGPETFVIPRWDRTSNNDVRPLMSVTILAVDLIVFPLIGWSRLPLLLYYYSALPSL